MYPPCKGSSKIFAAFVPDSPECFAFKDLKEFLNSPVAKKKGLRFKPCQDEREAENFFAEQSNAFTAEELDLSSGAMSSPGSSEPELPHKQLPARRLTEFKVAIEKQNNGKFDELLKENPRFLVNTSNHQPTIVNVGMHCNALHIACKAKNAYAVKRILAFIKDRKWLRNVYATEVCMRELSAKLLSAMLNTPDNNNTPLHYACKELHESAFNELIAHVECQRDMVNKHGEKPINLLGWHPDNAVGADVCRVGRIALGGEASGERPTGFCDGGE